MSFSFFLNCGKSEVFVSESSADGCRLTYHVVRFVNEDLLRHRRVRCHKVGRSSPAQRWDTHLYLYIPQSFIRHSPPYITSVLDRTTGPDRYRSTNCLKLQVLPVYSELVKWDVSLVLERLRSKPGEANQSFMKWASIVQCDGYSRMTSSALRSWIKSCLVVCCWYSEDSTDINTTCKPSGWKVVSPL